MPERARDEADKLQAALSVVFDGMFEGVQVIDPQWRYVYLNAAAAAHGRRSPGDLVGRTMMEAYPGIEATEMFGLLERCMKERTPQRMLNRFINPDGHAGWFDLRIEPVPTGVLVLSVDVSAEKAAEEELRRSREHLATVLNCMAEGVVSADVDGRVTGMNPAAEALTGWSEVEAKGRLLDDLVSFVNQRTGASADHPVATILRDGTVVGFANDTVLVGRGGRRTPIASSGAPMRDAEGEVRGVVVALKDMREEHELSQMLHHSQKMEAVGRLAGAVAHDFNNLLTVITGCADLLLQAIPDGDPRREDAQEILAAGHRAAALTGQLLAFSRSRPSESEVVDVADVLSGMQTLLRRLIGEDIDLLIKVEPALWRARFDASHLEQIVMNLAVNSRDAMPNGGKLTIEASNVELSEEYARLHVDAHPGPHVLVAVTDTGHGMDAETRERIFEPFFTTKPRGRGTGLGLATLYGSVKQAGGNVWVYSEPERGTTFKVYLPGAADPAGERPAAARAASAAPQEHATILLVEDEPAVRRLIRTVMERGGYQVLEAGEPREALHLCESHPGPVHLLLTDVVLQTMRGPDLAARARSLRPGLRVAYMSGYTDDALEHQGVVEAGAVFIEKPITPSALLRRLRDLLAGTEPVPGSSPRRATP